MAGDGDGSVPDHVREEFRRKEEELANEHLKDPVDANASDDDLKNDGKRTKRQRADKE